MCQLPRQLCLEAVIARAVEAAQDRARCSSRYAIRAFRAGYAQLPFEFGELCMQRVRSRQRELLQRPDRKLPSPSRTVIRRLSCKVRMLTVPPGPACLPLACYTGGCGLGIERQLRGGCIALPSSACPRGDRYDEVAVSG